MAGWRIESVDDLEKMPRVVGAFFLFVALFLFYSGTYEPVSKALAHAPSIHYGAKAVMVQPAVLLLGAVLMVLGPRSTAILGSRTRPSRWMWLVVIVGGVLGAAYEHGVGRYLNGLGYPVESVLQAWARLLHLVR